MHISEQLAGLFALAGFQARAIADGTEYQARIVGAGPAGQFCPDGARVLCFTVDATGRWLARLGAWGKVESDCDLRRYDGRPGDAWRDVAGDAWPAIAAKLERARDEALAQDDLCRSIAGLSKGKRRGKFQAMARDHLAGAILAADAIDGPLPADIAAMSTDELLAALTAP